MDDMDDRVTQFRVGMLVVATILIAALMILLFGEMPSLVRRQYTIYIRFPQAPGVTVDTPVTKSGILIGRVTRVTLLDNDDGAVVVTARIDAERTLRNNEVCRIGAGSILGDAVLEFVPSGQMRSPNAKIYRDQDYLDGIVAKDPLAVMETATSALQMLVNLEGDVRQALDSIQLAGEQVGGVAQGMNAVVANNAEQFQRILAKSEQAMDRFDFVMTAIDRFVRDDSLKQKLEEAISQVPDLMTDASDVMETVKESIGAFKETMNTVQSSLESFGDIGDRIDGLGDGIEEVMARANKNLENLEGLTGPLGAKGEELTTQLQGSLEKVDVVLTNLATFTDALNNSEGTIGQLMHNPELYDRINDAIAEINDTVREVNGAVKQIRPMVDRLDPILNDVRILTDKVSRDPRQLGIRGALDRRQSQTKW